MKAVPRVATDKRLHYVDATVNTKRRHYEREPAILPRRQEARMAEVRAMALPPNYSGQPGAILTDKRDWEFYFMSGDRLFVTCYTREDPERPGIFIQDGAVFGLSDLPNDLVSADDLVRLGFKLFDGRPVFECKLPLEPARG
jgi:hypothetical protein